MNEPRKTAARKMATNRTQKPNLSRFIIMPAVPPNPRKC
jgi:hypothetical protein